MRAKPTFKDILREVADENDARVLRRALLANALAKTVGARAWRRRERERIVARVCGIENGRLAA
jgi:hypothetical protein